MPRELGFTVFNVDTPQVERKYVTRIGLLSTALAFSLLYPSRSLLFGCIHRASVCLVVCVTLAFFWLYPSRLRIIGSIHHIRVFCCCIHCASVYLGLYIIERFMSMNVAWLFFLSLTSILGGNRMSGELVLTIFDADNQ